MSVSKRRKRKRKRQSTACDWFLGAFLLLINHFQFSPVRDCPCILLVKVSLLKDAERERERAREREREREFILSDKVKRGKIERRRRK